MDGDRVISVVLGNYTYLLRVFRGGGGKNRHGRRVSITFLAMRVGYYPCVVEDQKITTSDATTPDPLQLTSRGACYLCENNAHKWNCGKHPRHFLFCLGSSVSLSVCLALFACLSSFLFVWLSVCLPLSFHLPPPPLSLSLLLQPMPSGSPVESSWMTWQLGSWRLFRLDSCPGICRPTSPAILAWLQGSPQQRKNSQPHYR